MKTRLNTHIRLMAIAIFFVLLTGMSSLFSIYQMRQKLDLINQSHQKLLTATLAIEEAHTQFKMQIQEWKNLLLRGNNPEDFQKFYAAFNKQTDKVQLELNTAKSTLETNSLNQLDEVIKQHKDLVETYLNILSSAKLDSLNGIETADKSVRGMDRNLDNLFPQLTKDTTHTLQLKTLADNDLQASDYAQQTLLITGFVTISIIIIIISFWISHRKYS